MLKQGFLTGCFIAIMWLSGCKKGSFLNPDPPPEPTLPPETQTGARTFGCYVNDKLWLSETGVTELKGDYWKGTFLVRGKNGQEYIGIELDNVYQIGLYRLSNKNLRRYIYLSISGEHYDADSSEGSYINITKLDTNNVIHSGTFAFTGVNDRGEKVEVTGGRFDVKYKY